jgi:hypothetical protein
MANKHVEKFKTGNVYVVRPDGTPEDGYRDFDTVSGIASEWLRRNKEQKEFKGTFKEKQKAVEQWIVDQNELKTRQGKECDVLKDDPTIRVGQKLTLPVGNAVISPPQHKEKCPVTVPPRAPDVTVPPPVTTEAPPVTTTLPPAVVTGRPMAQLIVNPQGTVKDAVAVDAAQFFLGRPPQDAAAEWRGTPDKKREGLKPGTQEGTRVVTTAKKGLMEDTGFVPNADQLKLRRAGEGGAVLNIFTSGTGELEFWPGQHIRLGAKGEALGPNLNLNQKMEQSARLAVDANGTMRTVVDMHALISQNRRENPDYRGFIREAFTATNHLDRLNNTGEGVTLVTSYLGLERAYEQTGKRYYDGKPTAADAEKLLQLNVQAALHPLVWSVDSYGVPNKGPAVLQAEMDKVIAALPAGDDKARLMATYVKPYRELLDDPTKLHAQIKAAGGLKGWENPMEAWAQERSKLAFIQEGYGDVPITEEQKKAKLGVLYTDDNAYGKAGNLGAKEIGELRKEEATRVAPIYARKVWEESIRPPTPSEVALGTGLLHDADAQKEGVLAQSRTALLTQLRDDPKARAAWVGHMLATPGGLQNVSDLLHFSSNENSGNHQLLGFKDAAEGRNAAKALASKMAGAAEGEALMRQEHTVLQNVGHSFVRFVTVGMVNPGKNDNQNNGLFQFQEETARRWNDPATRQEVDAAVKEILDRSIAAQKRDAQVGSVASTALVITMDPNRAEDVGTTKTHAALTAAVGDAGKKTMTDQMVANLDHAGERHVTAAVYRASQELAAQGKVTSVNIGAAEQAAAAGSAVLAGGDRDKFGTLETDKTTSISRLPLATGAGAAAAAFVSPDGSLVNQAQLNAHLLKLSASAAPADLLTLLASNRAEAERHGKTEVVAALDAKINHMSQEQGPAGRDLADLVRKQYGSLLLAGSTPEALAATKASFGDFFAGKGGNGITGQDVVAGASRALSAISSPAGAIMAAVNTGIEVMPAGDGKSAAGAVVGAVGTGMALAGGGVGAATTAARLGVSVLPESEGKAAIQSGMNAAGTAQALAAGGPGAGLIVAGAATDYLATSTSAVANSRAIAANTLASEMAKDAALTAIFAGPQAAAGASAKNPLSGLSAEARGALMQAAQSSKDPEQQGQALKAWAGQYARDLNSLNAGAGISLVEAAKWAALLAIPRDKPREPEPTTTLPPITTTLPPITTTLPPITTTLPPITTTLPPITTTLPPVTTTLPPITTTLPPVTTTLPPVTTTLPPVTTTLPPVTTTLPPVTTTLPPVTTTVPIPTGTPPGCGINGTPCPTPPPPPTTTLPPPTTLPPVTTTLPPVTTTLPPVTTTLPPVTTTLPPVTTTLPPVTTTVPIPTGTPPGCGINGTPCPTPPPPPTTTLPPPTTLPPVTTTLPPMTTTLPPVTTTVPVPTGTPPVCGINGTPCPTPPPPPTTTLPPPTTLPPVTTTLPPPTRPIDCSPVDPLCSPPPPPTPPVTVGAATLRGLKGVIVAEAPRKSETDSVDQVVASLGKSGINTGVQSATEVDAPKLAAAPPEPDGKGGGRQA